MKAVAGVQQADQFCHHLCANPLCGHVFEDLDKGQWEAHRSDSCPECCMRRFKNVGGRLAPRRRCVPGSCGVGNVVCQTCHGIAFDVAEFLR